MVLPLRKQGASPLSSSLCKVSIEISSVRHKEIEHGFDSREFVELRTPGSQSVVASCVLEVNVVSCSVFSWVKCGYGCHSLGVVLSIHTSSKHQPFVVGCSK